MAGSVDTCTPAQVTTEVLVELGQTPQSEVIMYSTGFEGHRNFVPVQLNVSTPKWILSKSREMSLGVE